MSMKKLNLKLRVLAKDEGEGDAVSYSTDTSRWSTPSRLCSSSNSPQCSSDVEDQVKTKSKPCGRKTDKKVQATIKQKTNTSSCKDQKLPAIKPLQVSKPQTTNLTCFMDLKSQVWDLQQQLCEAQTENKLLKRLQHHHTMSLQHFQEAEGSVSQILTKHKNETRVLQGHLREVRACRDHLAKQLKATENKLLNTKASLQQLQLLCHNHRLLERKDLTCLLDKATAELEEKDKMIQDLKKNLKLCQDSFNRQLVTEQRKVSEMRKISCYQQEQIHQLIKEIQHRQKEQNAQNIYSHRLLKAPVKKGSENKMVQTDSERLVLVPTEAAHLSEVESLDTEETQEEQNAVSSCCSPVQTSLEIENLKLEDPSHDTLEEICLDDTDNSESDSCLEESLEHQREEDSAETPEMLEEEQKTDEQDSEGSLFDYKFAK